MRDHRRFLDILKRADEDRVGLRLVDDQTSPFELDFPTVAPIADNDDLWDIEAPVEEIEIEEVPMKDKSLDQVVADLVLDEEEAIEGYENAEEAVIASEEISEDKKDEILAVLDHIKEEEEEHIDELTEIVSEDETEVDANDEESEDTEDSAEEETTIVSNLQETTGTDEEYCITYRVANRPASETTEVCLIANSEESARESFLDYMLDPDNYDAGETVLSESDIEVINIYKKSEKLAEGKRSKKLNEAAPVKDPFTWTVGSDSYDISNNAELRSYIDAAAAEKLPTITTEWPDRPEDANVWNAYAEVFEDLITYYENRPYVDHQFINRLRVLEERILHDLDLDEDEQQAQEEIEDLATTCVEQFLKEMKKLTEFYDYNIDEHYCQSYVDTIKEDLVKLGRLLAQPNYVED